MAMWAGLRIYRYKPQTTSQLVQTSLFCSACKNSRTIADPQSGEQVCADCGVVFSDRAEDSKPEWRNFYSENSSRARVGSPTSLAQHDMGLATVIGRNNSDSSGRKLDASTISTIQRLRTWDFRTQVHSSTERNLIRAFEELGRLKGKLGLSDAIIEKTAYIYRKGLEKKLVRGRSTVSMLAAAAYMACREMEAPRSLKDVAESTNLKRKDISRSYRLLALQLDIRVPQADPMKCIARVANKARISERSKRTAINRMKDLTKKEISAGKSPMGFAATILYLSCLDNNEHITQKDIANAAGVTEVTIRNRLNDLKTRLNLW